MKKSSLKIKKFSKINLVAIFVIVILFFSYYGITSYTSKGNEEEPRWMICQHKKGDEDHEKPLYIKFHNTDKIQWDHKKYKWVKSKYKGLREMMPTIEMHEDKSHFEESRYLWKLRPIYQSDKYYVFYQTTGGFSIFGTPPPVKAQHIIMNRDDLSLLYYENEWILNEYRKRKYNDDEIDQLFKEVNTFVYYRTEKIILSNGKTLTAPKSLDLFQCKEVSSIKPKI
jgi:hypothetical protein